jgi:CubicO group peptidase (beta-lactamase class C family)
MEYPVSLLPETADRIGRRVAGAQSAGRVPSLVAGVLADGALVHVAAAGEVPAPDADTQYRIGSISKTLTAVLVMQLRDAGTLELDDPLRRHLPGTPVGGVTLRALLGHVSGLQREPDGDWWERAAGVDVDTLLTGLAADKLAGPPYRGHHYSNLAYGLLGAVLERVTGTPWAKLVAERLLDPLGMRRTTYGPAEPFARGYVVHPWHGTLREEPRFDAGAMAPAGQLWSTVSDLARWAAFVADPDPSVLKPDTLAQMCAPVVISDLESWTAGHGLGWQLWRRGERVFVGHTGSMPGYLAVLAAHRPTRTGVVAFTNAYTMRGGGLPALAFELLDEVVADRTVRPAPWRPGAVPPPDVAPLTGRWWWMGREYEVAYDAAGRELVVRGLERDDAPWRFRDDGQDRWRGVAGENTGELLRVRRSPNGTVAALDIATFVFTRDPLPSL